MRERLEQGEHLLMLAPRRIGKTSLMLEVCGNPAPHWDAIYVDLEGGASAADCIAAIMARLARNAKYRTWLESIPFRESVSNLLRSTTLRVEIEATHVH